MAYTVGTGGVNKSTTAMTAKDYYSGRIQQSLGEAGYYSEVPYLSSDRAGGNAGPGQRATGWAGGSMADAAYSAKLGNVGMWTRGRGLYGADGATSRYLQGLGYSDDFNRIQGQLRAAGLLSGSYAIGNPYDEKTQKAWMKLLGHANLSGVSWKQALAGLLRGSGGNGPGGGRGRGNPWGSGPRRVTTTNTSYQYRETTRADAEALLLDMWRNYFGRSPHDPEVDAFHTDLNKRQRANPTVTTTTTTTDRLTGSSTTKSTVKEGEDQSAVALDETRSTAKTDVESKAYRIGAFTDVLLSMVGLNSGPGGGIP